MEQRKNRISVGGLRKANPTHLAVLVQDVLRLPVLQLDPRTFLDVMALSEIASQVSTQLAKELAAFRDQKLREIGDLPDGPPLADFLRDLHSVDAGLHPACVREGIIAICEECRHEDVEPAFDALQRHWDSEDPLEIELPKAPPPAAKKPAAAASAPAAAAKQPRHEILKPADRTPRRAVPRANEDSRREEWIREDVLSRLVNYGTRGLKEQIVVAGTRHRSSWTDLTELEVLTVLRKLKREGRVRFSAGRWMIVG